VWAVVVDCAPIRFTYRTQRSGEVRERHVQPWGLASWHGRWYLTGYDVDRADARVFRLGRIESAVTRAGKPGSYDVPPDHDPRQAISMQAGDGPAQPVRVRVRVGAGHALRRRAETSPAAQDTVPPADSSRAATDSAWDEVQLRATDVEALADELASYGPDVVALEPPALVEATRWRLQGVLDAHGGAR